MVWPNTIIKTMSVHHPKHHILNIVLKIMSLLRAEYYLQRFLNSRPRRRFGSTASENDQLIKLERRLDTAMWTWVFFLLIFIVCFQMISMLLSTIAKHLQSPASPHAAELYSWTLTRRYRWILLWKLERLTNKRRFNPFQIFVEVVFCKVSKGT